MNKISTSSKFLHIEEIKSICAPQRAQPLIVEVMGTPNSGKTSALNTLDTLLRRYKITNVKIIYEAAQKCSISKKYSVQFNLWTALETMKNIIHNIDKGYDIIICERGTFDAICWAKTYYNDNAISDEEFKLVYNFYNSFDWAKYLKYILVVMCEPEIAIAREEKNEMILKEGTIVNDSVLKKLNRAIKESIHIMDNSSDNIYYSLIDTTNRDKQNTNSIIVRSILNFIKNT